MKAIIFTDIIIEIDTTDDGLLAGITQLILELKVNGGILTTLTLSPFESGPRAWNTDQPIGFPVADGMKCMITVSKNVAGNELGFLNLEGFGPDVVTGNKYEIPFTCHEGSPSLLLKTKVVIPTRVEVRYPEGSIEQVRQDARAAFDNFDRYGKLEDLEKAIANYKKDVEMTPKDDPEIHVALNNLALCIGARFEQLGRREDIDYSIALIRTSMKPNQYGAPIPIYSLITLGNSLRQRYEQYGDPLDLEDSILQQQKAVDITPDGDARKPLLLCNLGSTFERRYERTGEPSDLNTAIVHGQLAIDLAPDSHPQKHLFLTNQGNSLQKRSERFGDLSDLDNGIVQQQLAVNLVPDGHPQRFMHLCNLGSALRVRSERLRNVADLDAAISYQRLGVSLIPKGHIEKPRYESGLGDSFFTRFEQLGNVSDINEAITRHRSAVSLAPEGHPSKLLYRNNLSICLMARFERLGNTIDIDDAIAEQQTALDLAPDNHPSKSMYFCNLGSSLATRFLRCRDISDLDNAIINHQKAVDLQSDTHYDNPTFLNNLAQSLRTRYRHLGDTRDAEDAIKHFSTSAMSSVGPAGIRFKAARGWILLAHSIHHTSLLEAYERALELMPVVAWLGLPLADRHRQLVEIGGMAREAAAAAISLEQYDKAIEWLEQGRSIVWTQLLQLRTPIDDLREVDPDLAKRLLEVSQLLDRGSGDMNVSGGGTAQDIEAEGRRYRGLTMEWESIIKKVRSLPNFETFLKPPSFSHLMKAAQNGPVVVLNIAEERCDALALVDGTDEVIHIPLPNITSKRVTELRDELMDMLSSDGIRERGEMRGRAAKFIEEPNDEEACKHILMELWTCVVKPVLDSLAFSAHPDTLSRIWWCVTGPLAFLPIHAAGIYGQNPVNDELANYVISSYTPTLSALLQPSHSLVDSSFKLLSVIQSSAPGASSIPSTKTELDHVRRHISEDAHVILEEQDGTKKAVMMEMEECNWIHLACHGIQMPEDPTKSALLLQDGRLTLEEIIKLRLPKAEFAFLSACQTTAGDIRLSEESVHIAAGMQLAGYRSIVATMWSIRDDLAPEVADEFYRHIMRVGRRPDAREAAEALHTAVQKLRKKENVPFTAWIPYVHLGI